MRNALVGVAFDAGKIVSAFSLDKTTTFVDGSEASTALLGAFAVEEGFEPKFLEQLSATVEDVFNECDFVVAPASYPVQVFGSGVQSWHEAGGKPFLEASLPDVLGDALMHLGLKPAGEKQYRRVAIKGFAGETSQLARGYKKLSMSWELVDGDTGLKELADRVGETDADVDMPFFATRRVQGNVVPKPHFNAAGS